MGYALALNSNPHRSAPPVRRNDVPADTEQDCESRYWVLQDGMFNVLGLVSDTGELVERYEYDPYGGRHVYVSAGSNDPLCHTPKYLSTRWQLTASPGIDQPWGLCAFGFQGLMHDDETGPNGLIYNRARMLHVALGRFLQRDPLGYIDGMSLYAAYHILHGGWDPSGLGLDAESSKIYRVRRMYIGDKLTDIHRSHADSWRACDRILRQMMNTRDYCEYKRLRCEELLCRKQYYQQYASDILALYNSERSHLLRLMQVPTAPNAWGPSGTQHDGLTVTNVTVEFVITAVSAWSEEVTAIAQGRQSFKFGRVVGGLLFDNDRPGAAEVAASTADFTASTGFATATGLASTTMSLWKAFKKISLPALIASAAGYGTAYLTDVYSRSQERGFDRRHSVDHEKWINDQIAATRKNMLHIFASYRQARGEQSYYDDGLKDRQCASEGRGVP